MLAELAERAAKSYGAAVKAWLETAYTLHEARAIAQHGEWTRFLRQAEIPERTGRRMLQVARAGLKTDTVTVLGGIRETLDALSADAKLVRELTKALDRIAELERELGDARSELVDMEEREALRETAPEHAEHFRDLAEQQRDRRQLRTALWGEKEGRAKTEAEAKRHRTRATAAELRAGELAA